MQTMTRRYVASSHELKLEDGSLRTYTIPNLKEMPEWEKPRGKMQALGPEHLSAAELLAAIFSTGTKKENVLEMTERIMKEYGERSIMDARNPLKLEDDLNIPELKAVQLVAVAELGRRFFRRNQNTIAPVVRTAKDVFDHVTDMRNLSKEHLRGLYLNPHYRVIHDEVISIGTVDTNMVHPREVFKPAIEYAAAAVVLVHNHPSGVTDPSPADVAVTKQLIEAGRIVGIDLIDHVIVTKDNFASIPAPYHT
jgi:DNA repair protein RadC